MTITKVRQTLPVVVVTIIHNKALKILQTVNNWENITCHLQNEGGLPPSPRKVHTKNDRVFPINKRFEKTLRLEVRNGDSRWQIRHHTYSKNAKKEQLGSL